MRQPIVVTYDIRTPRWCGDAISIVVLSDLHVAWPWTSLTHLRSVVVRINAMTPDLILLPGDFLANPGLFGRPAEAAEIVEALGALRARYGVFASLGNHDWKDCPLVAAHGAARNSVVEAFDNSPISLLVNAAQPVGPFWVAGTDSCQGVGNTRYPKPRHDLRVALAGIPEGADVILMAHEPDLWVDDHPEVALTVSGHTHAGQITLGNWRPLTPSRYGGRYAHGLFQDNGRVLVVSAGLGYSGIPLRIGAPPEITRITLSGL